MTTTQRFVFFQLCCILSFYCCYGFVVTKPNNVFPSTSTALRVIPPEIAADVSFARGQFYLWFIGSLGGLGVGVSSIPRLLGATQYINSLKGSPSLGGDNLGLNFFCGYPEDLSIKDVEQIANNRLSITQLVEKFPIENNFLSSKGYLVFRAFQQANDGANPLAVRAVFDSFSQSQDTCDPNVAQDKLDSYKSNVFALNNELLKAKVIGYSSIFTLVFLLGLAESIALAGAKDGWFPDWTLNDGIFSIPQYWI